jgi:hypothetical protein
MPRKYVIKTAGISGLIGGVLVILTRIIEVSLFGTISESQKIISDKFFIVGIISLLGSLLIVLEITGAYLLFEKRFSYVEAIAYFIYYIGAILGFGANWTYAFGLQQIAKASPEFIDAVYPGLLSQGMLFSYGIAFIGTFLVAAIIIIRKPLPRWVGVVMIVSYLIMIIFGLDQRNLPILCNIMIASGLIAFGYALLTDIQEKYL